MLTQSLVVAQKEILDSLRDVRSIISSLLYALMGPAVITLVALSGSLAGKPEASRNVLAGMMSVFTLVAAFVGGMNIAMDTVAGERERRSLLPLLLNAVPRFEILLGKWLAVSFFSIAGLAINLAGFTPLFAVSSMPAPSAPLHLAAALVLGVFPLALFAASLQLWISTVSRSIKEAQTYLSSVVFVPMAAGMFLVFFPQAVRGWCGFLPVLGQQMTLELLLKGHDVSLVQCVGLGLFTILMSMLILATAAGRLQSDEIIYGN